MRILYVMSWWFVFAFLFWGFYLPTMRVLKLDTKEGGKKKFCHRIQKHKMVKTGKTVVPQNVSVKCHNSIADAAAYVVIQDISLLGFAGLQAGMAQFSNALFQGDIGTVYCSSQTSRNKVFSGAPDFLSVDVGQKDRGDPQFKWCEICLWCDVHSARVSFLWRFEVLWTKTSGNCTIYWRHCPIDDHLCYLWCCCHGEDDRYFGEQYNLYSKWEIDALLCALCKQLYVGCDVSMYDSFGSF